MPPRQQNASRVDTEATHRCPDCGCGYVRDVGNCGDLTGCSRPRVLPIPEAERLQARFEAVIDQAGSDLADWWQENRDPDTRLALGLRDSMAEVVLRSAGFPVLMTAVAERDRYKAALEAIAIRQQVRLSDTATQIAREALNGGEDG